MTLTGLLIVYAFTGCAYWLWMLVGAVRLVRGIPKLADEQVPPPEEWPRLSIVIPACNEADSLESALCSILQQDYPDFEIVLIDDRSTDGTAAIVDRLAATNPRIRAIHVEVLPDGWLGKVHALSLGTQKSSGTWLLYTDADVHLAPGTLRQAVAYALHHRADHLAAFPDLWPSSLLVGANLSLFCRTFLVAMRFWSVNDPKSDAFVGIGAFNLVRREALDKTEGFRWLRLEVGDDMGLGMMLRQSGVRQRVVYAHKLLGLYWYRSLQEMAHGAEKAYASAARCSLVRAIALCAVMLAMEWSPLVALASWKVPGLMWSGLAMLAAAVASSVILARWSRQSVLPGLLFPLSALVSSGVMLRSGWLGHRRGGVVWRGTLYHKADLIAGRRLKIF